MLIFIITLLIIMVICAALSSVFLHESFFGYFTKTENWFEMLVFILCYQIFLMNFIISLIITMILTSIFKHLVE